MVIPVTTPAPAFPKNRRRMRRGARKRHALSRKVDPREEYREGASLAYDTSFVRLSGAAYAGAQPHSLELERLTQERHSLENSWIEWLAHEVLREEEDEQFRLFGGVADDDALRANGILYDSIRDTREEPKDGDPFPPLPPRRTISRSARPKTLKTAYRRPAPALTIPTPPLLSSHLFDDSEIQRLTTFQSAPSEPSEPSEKEDQECQSLPPRTSTFSTQFPVPLRIPAAAARKDSFIDTTTPNAKPSEVSWTLIPHDPDWVLLDDDS